MRTDVGSFKSYQLNEGRTTPVPVRVSPIEKIRGEIDAVFDGSRELSEVIEEIARLGARLIIQTALEAEVDVFLGRARYQRAAECPDARAGSRNGYGETHSASRFYEFQARRLNIRYRAADGVMKFVHTLNNTVIASPRVLIPVLELYQNADGSITVPKALWPYMGGMEKITRKA